MRGVPSGQLLALLSLLCLLVNHAIATGHRIYRREERPKKLKFESQLETGCDVISFPNATINQCGFCVGGDTGLDIHYGKDCRGVCFGNATIDCQGICGGRAYVDECTGKCINPDLAGQLSTNRDCRGLCIQPLGDLSGSVPIPSQVYSVDRCGICRLSQSTAAGFGGGSGGAVAAPSIETTGLDCAGNCQLPGLSKYSVVCGQCIRQSELYSVMDECGNCLSEGHACSCDRDPVRCGCIDPNNCYVIRSLSPGAIPSNVPVNISIVGYFYPYIKPFYCVARLQGFEVVVESFPVQFLHKNKTVIQCSLQLTQVGQYVVGLGFRKDVFITPLKDLLHVYAFDVRSVNLSLIRPVKSWTNESESNLVIEFEDNNDQLPPVPFKCRIVYQNGQSELGEFGAKPNSCLLPKSTKRLHSQVVTIYPTFDGVNILPSTMHHLIEAPAPKIFPLTSFISEDGLSIVINFDRSIDLDALDSSMRENTDDEDDEGLVMCDYLLSESTIEHLSLFGLERCKWATRVQLIISILRPLSSDSIDVVLKRQVLLEYNQQYPLANTVELSANISKLSNSLNWWSYEPMLTVTGPSEVPACDDANFALIGHFSSPRGSHEVDFQWEVVSEASNELRQYVTRNGKSTNLLLSTDMLEVGIEYHFVLRALVHARRQSLEADHTLIKLNYNAPLVSLYHTRLLHSLPLHQNDNITLFGHVKVPDCIYPPQRINLHWRVTDPLFKFPLWDTTKRSSVIYTIDQYSVPANHSTSITLESHIGFYHNQSSSATFRFEPLPEALKANIGGGVHKITIGTNSGLLELSAPSLPRTRLVYQWSCHETKSAQPCYFNFATVPTGYQRNPLLFTRDMQNKAKITIDTQWFQPNNQYLIGLQIFNANNSQRSSETEYVLLNVMEGARPQVFVGPVYIKGQFLVPYNTRFSTFVIPSGSSIVIRGNAFLPTGLAKVRWQSNTFRYPLSWSNKQINSQQIITELYIHEDTLTAYGVYNFKLEACSELDLCSSSEISLMSAQSTTMCDVVVESYVELELSLASVEKCSLPPSASPITFQLFVEDDNFPTLLPLTTPQLSPVIEFAGTPAFNQLTRLAARVCDIFNTCTWHFSQPIRVENTANVSHSTEQLQQRARRLYQSGDILAALSTLNPLFLKPDPFNESYLAYEKSINASIEFCTSALQMHNMVLSSGHYELAFNALSFALLKTNNFELRSKLLDLINRFFEKAEAMQMKVPINTIRMLYSNVMSSFILSKEQRKNNVTINPTFLQDVRETFRQIKKAAASKLPLGSRVTLVAERIDEQHLDRDGLPVRLHTALTEIGHSTSAIEVELHARLFANQTVTAKVQFGEEVKQNFSSRWQCGQKMPCNSVIYTVTVFPGESPYPSTKQVAHRLSPIVDITIHAPNTGQEQNVRGLFKATVFDVTVTGNESYGGSDYTTKCHYFDEEQQEWLMDDVQPLGIAYNHAGCWSGHLSSFVVLRTVLGISADYVIGVLVACLMGVLVFGIMLVFYVQRKRENDQMLASEDSLESKGSNAMAKSVSKRNEHEPVKTRKPRANRVATEIQTQTILVAD